MNRAPFRSLIRIPRETVFWKKFSAAAGRGGQHVNRVDTAVEVRFSVDETWISPFDRILLKRDFPHLITKKDEIVLIETKHREPLRNFEKALKDFEATVNPAIEAEEKFIEQKKKTIFGKSQSEKTRKGERETAQE